MTTLIDAAPVRELADALIRQQDYFAMKCTPAGTWHDGHNSGIASALSSAAMQLLDVLEKSREYNVYGNCDEVPPPQCDRSNLSITAAPAIEGTKNTTIA